MTATTVIRNVSAVTMDAALGDLSGVDIVVTGDRITSIGRGIEIPADAMVIDGTKMIAMPGMVDGHRHIWQTQLRGVATDWTIVDYMVTMRTLYCVCYEPEDAYLGNLVGGIEALAAGVTSVVDHSHLQLTPEHSDALAQGLIESGVGGFFCYGFYNNPPYRPGDPIDVDRIRDRVFAPVEGWHIENARRVRDRYFASPQPLRFGVAASEVFMIPLELAVRELTAAWSLDPGLVTAHWACTARAEGRPSMLPELHAAGMLRSNMVLTHGNNFTDRDFALLAEVGAGVCATPDTELGMGMGFPVQQQVIAAGGNVVFGADICSNVAGDLFAQIRLALQSQRWANEMGIGLLPTTMSVSAREYLHIATQGGANAIGMGAEVGSLTPGKRADIVLLRTDSLNMAPVRDLVGAIVFYANVADIDTVLVGGRTVKRHGSLVGVDWERLRERLEASRDRIDERYKKIPFEKVQSVWHTAIGGAHVDIGGGTARIED